MTIEMDIDVSRETEELFENEFGEVSRETTEDYSPPVGGVKTGDPDAPYGFTSDGKVRAKPGRRPGQKTGTGKTASKATTAPPKKAAGPTRPAARKTQVDYRPALMNLSGQAISALAITGLIRNNMTALADAAALANGQVGLVEMLNTAADQHAFVGAIFDKVLKFGPYAEGGFSLAIMVGQVLVNHGVIPAGLMPGTQTPAALVDAFIARQMAESDTFRATAEMLHKLGEPAAS